MTRFKCGKDFSVSALQNLILLNASSFVLVFNVHSRKFEVLINLVKTKNFEEPFKSKQLAPWAPNVNFSENICSEDDLSSRIFGAFVVKFLACLPLLGFSNIYKMV